MDETARDVPPPVLLSAIVCDAVIVDKRTDKGTVVGVFDTIHAPQYPARHHTLCLFCQLTNGRGRVGVHIRIVDLEDEEKVLIETTLPAEFVDVRQVANVIWEVGGLVFPHPGEYRVQLLVGTEFLGERRILCKKVESPPGGKTDE